MNWRVDGIGCHCRPTLRRYLTSSDAALGLPRSGSSMWDAVRESSCSTFGPREIVELDLAESMLLENRKKPEAKSAAHVCAEAQRPPFRDGSFDRVICFNALPHFTPLDGSLRQMLHRLRPGGLLCIGHSMGSEQLNHFHSGVGGPVGHDRLPAARILGRLLSTLGAAVLCAEDEDGWYCVQARKP